MHYIHIKHDNCQSNSKNAEGFNGKTRMSVGPFSRKAAIAEANKIRMEHREWHILHSPYVVCIVKVEREPIDV